MIKTTAPDTFNKLKLSLKKAQGMLKKIDTMLEEDAYCPETAQQVNATIGLLKSMNVVLLKQHLKCCGVPQLSSKDAHKVDGFIEEFFKILDVTQRK